MTQQAKEDFALRRRPAPHRHCRPPLHRPLHRPLHLRQMSIPPLLPRMMMYQRRRPHLLLRYREQKTRWVSVQMALVRVTL